MNENQGKRTGHGKNHGILPSGLTESPSVWGRVWNLPVCSEWRQPAFPSAATPACRERLLSLDLPYLGTGNKKGPVSFLLLTTFTTSQQPGLYPFFFRHLKLPRK